MPFFIIYLLSSNVADCGKEIGTIYGKHTASVLSCISSVNTFCLVKYVHDFEGFCQGVSSSWDEYLSVYSTAS